jgi:hypothetical protein
VAALVGTGSPDHDRGGVGHGAVPLLALPQGLLDPLPLGDVLGDPGDPHDSPRLIPDREASVPDPTDGPIGAQDAVFLGRRLAAVSPEPLVGQHRPLTVLGVDGFEVRLGPLVEGPAGSAPDRFVGRAHVGRLGAVEVVHPEHIGDVVGQLAEPFLTLPLRLLGLTALRDIPEDDDDTPVCPGSPE